MPKIRTGITCRKLSENAVAVTPLFTTFGKQPRFFTLGKISAGSIQCRQQTSNQKQAMVTLQCN